MKKEETAAKKPRHFVIQYNSAVILSFTFLSLFVLLLGILTEGQSTALLFSAYKTSWTDPLQYVRLFTHVLGHASFEHLLGNFMIILLVGPMIEEKYGSKCVLILIIVTAFITGLINVLFFDKALLGASGVDFMLILLSSYANFEKGKIPLTLILVVVAFVGREVADGLFTSDNISQLTHIIGGAVGGIVGYFISGENKRMKDLMPEAAPVAGLTAATVAPAVPEATPVDSPVDSPVDTPMPVSATALAPKIDESKEV